TMHDQDLPGVTTLSQESKISSMLLKTLARGNFPLFPAPWPLAQNWTFFCCVVTLGRGEPSTVFQMIGWCGRDGKPGLGIMFVEKSQVGGKKNLDQITQNGQKNENYWMNALEITPFEISLEIPMCLCSNCMPITAKLLLERIFILTK
ncbi:hypothetical protein VP01_3370g6, partial [Puccinia sorghi]